MYVGDGSTMIMFLFLPFARPPNPPLQTNLRMAGDHLRGRQRSVTCTSPLLLRQPSSCSLCRPKIDPPLMQSLCSGCPKSESPQLAYDLWLCNVSPAPISDPAHVGPLSLNRLAMVHALSAAKAGHFTRFGRPAVDSDALSRPYSLPMTGLAVDVPYPLRALSCPVLLHPLLPYVWLLLSYRRVRSQGEYFVTSAELPKRRPMSQEASSLEHL